MYSRFSRCRTARGSGTGLRLVGPAKVKASKSILFTEVSPEVEISLYLFGHPCSEITILLKRPNCIQ